MSKYITKKALSERMFGNEQYTPGDKNTKYLSVRVTSGTAGLPSVTVVSHEPVIKTKEYQEYFLQPITSLVRISGRHLPCLLTAQLIFEHSRRKNVQALFLEQKDIENQQMGRILNEAAPTEIRSTPSYLHRFFTILAKTNGGKSLKKIKYVILAGEQIGRWHIENIKKYMPTARIAPEYALSELGYVTYQCRFLQERYPQMPFSVFHIIPSRVVTIIEKNQEGIGEIVIATPEIKNYKTGDLGKFVRDNCPCGKRKTLILEGRKDFDVVHAAGAVFYKTIVDSVFSKYSDLVSDYIVEVRDIDDGMKIVGHVTYNIVPTNKFKRRFKNKEYLFAELINKELFVTPTRTLADLIGEEIFQPSTVRCVDAVSQKVKSITLKYIRT